MADIPQLLANYDALVGVALGAGLTYGFSALNRRHQEARENETRWYQQRLQAYVDFYRAYAELYWATSNQQTTVAFRKEEARKLFSLLSVIEFVGSPEVIEAAGKVFDATAEEMKKDQPFSGNDDVDLDALVDGLSQRPRPL
jgi:hypothetical protein